MKKIEIDEMECDIPEEIDFSKAVKSPFPKLLKQQVTINLSKEVVAYFKNESKNTGVPYQTLINLYLLDCANKQKKLNLEWK